jgi:hypothetical protein
MRWTRATVRGARPTGCPPSVDTRLRAEAVQRWQQRRNHIQRARGCGPVAVFEGHGKPSLRRTRRPPPSGADHEGRLQREDQEGDDMAGHVRTHGWARRNERLHPLPSAKPRSDYADRKSRTRSSWCGGRSVWSDRAVLLIGPSPQSWYGYEDNNGMKA